MHDPISAALDAGPMDGQAIVALTKGALKGKARVAVAITAERRNLILQANVIWVLKALTRQHQPRGAVSVTSASQAAATEIPLTRALIQHYLPDQSG